MAGEAELKIGSGSVEKTTAALDSLIGTLEKLVAAQTKQTKSTEGSSKSLDSATGAVKQSEIARNKAISLLELESKGLDKTSDAYIKLKGEILAQEVAAKKNISTSAEDYNQLLSNITAKEQAATANKKLTDSINTQSIAAKNSQASATKTVSMLELEQKGLSKNSEQYAKLRAEILAKEIATRKNIDTSSAEYQQILKSTKAQEVAAAKLRELTAEKKNLEKAGNSGNGVMGKFTGTLDGFAKQAQLVDGPMGGIASRITSLSSIIKSGALAFAAIGIAITGVIYGISKGSSVAADQEVRMATLSGQLTATGNAAGYSAEQLDILSRSLGFSTLDSSQGMKEIIRQMLVFDKVTDKAFSRAISLSGDLGISMGTGGAAAARRLGKILQEPLKYYKELARVGVTFNEGQITAIESAIVLGENYKAQAVILDALESKIGGVAAAQANGLTGDLDTFGQKWEEFWETSGKKALPTLRDIVQVGNAALDIAQRGIETEGETNLRQFKLASLEQTQTLEGTRELIKSVSAEYDAKLANAKKTMTAEQKFWLDSGVIYNSAINSLNEILGIEERVALVSPARVDAFKTEAQLLEDERDAVLKYLKDIEDIKSGRDIRPDTLTAEQVEYIKNLKETAAQESILAQVFLRTGDTRSEAYRKQKAAFDAYNESVKTGLNLSPKELANLNLIFQSRQKVTESIVAGNIVIQKERSLLNQQDALKKELDLNKLVSEGMQKNSFEYLKTSALIDLRNKTLASGGSIQDDNYQRLEKETIALVGLQAEMRKVVALRQFDSESSTTKALEKSIELNKLLTTGVSETSDKYIRYNMELNARNVALQQGLEVGSADYQLLLNKAQAVADLQIELQKMKEVGELGLKFDSSGELISEDSLAGLQDSANKSIATIMDVALAQGLQIDDPLVQKLFADINAKFQDGKNSILAPFGLVFDEEGSLLAMDSEQALLAERDQLLREMKLAAQELDLEEDQTYLERKAAIMREYDEAMADARAETWEQNAEHLARVRAADTANSISSGLETLAAVAGNNKKLARMAKAASMFAASASLVDALSEAAGESYPLNAILYAKAFAQGTQLIQMASSLKEPSFAFGGVDIQGAGTGRSDSIKANIARGESVVTAPATAQYKDTLRRMNAGLPLSNGGGGQNVSMPLSINIQGDASENTVRLIDESLRNFENKVQQISQGVSMQTIQSEQNYGGLLSKY